MARVEDQDTWTTAGDMKTVQEALRRFFAGHQMKIIEDRDGDFTVKQGSQFLTRLLGGWFVRPAWLPKEARVRLRQTDSGVRLGVVIEESLGLGIMDPILQNKYAKFFRSWLDDLHDALPQI